jgi:putative hemolysin
VTIAIEFIVILLLILCNGLLAMAEFAVVSARPTRLQERAAAGSVGARAALELTETPDRFLATIQFGISLIGILAGAFGGARLAQHLADSLGDLPLIGGYQDAAAFILVVGATTYLSLVIGELVPKRLALQRPERIATVLARPLKLLANAGRPVVALLSASTRAVLALLGANEPVEEQVTEEEIRVMLAQGARTGAIRAAEEEMTVGILNLGDLQASDLMTPRRQVVWIDVQEDEQVSRQLIAASGHSYYPIYEANLDHILGFVAVKELWREGNFELRKVLTPPLYVPESGPAFTVLELFKQTGVRRALVVDEYGVIQGLITMHDIMEAIVGELDQPAEADQPIVERDDGSWLIDGTVPLHELRDALGVEYFPDEERGRYQTLGGFVLASLGRIPAPSEHVEWSGWRFEIVDMDGVRIDKVLVAPLDQEEDGDAFRPA